MTRINKENRTSSCMIGFMVTPEIKAKIDRKIKSSRLTRREFILRAIFNKPIVVMNGGDELVTQLRRLANNYNQTLKRVYLKQAYTEELRDAWQMCNDLILQINAMLGGETNADIQGGE